MPLKLFISDYTFRTEAYQLALLTREPELTNAPIFGPDDLQTIFRPTQRKERDTYYAASVACFAPNEERFKEFIGLCRVKKTCLASLEEKFTWTPQQSTSGAIKAWKAARSNGVAKIGGRISAELRRKQSLEGASKIKDRWGMPSKTWPTKVLLKEADQTYNTAISILGPRPIAQYNYQAKLKRQKLKEDRANV